MAQQLGQQPSPQQVGQSQPQSAMTDAAKKQVIVAIKVVLDGKDLSQFGLKQLRHAVAAHLHMGNCFPSGDGRDGLEANKDWFNELAQPIVDELAAP